MKRYNKTLYTLITILIVYTISFTLFIFYSITNFAFSDFYKRLDLRRNLSAEELLNNKDNGSNWTSDYIKDLDSQHSFFVEFDPRTGRIISSNSFDHSLWSAIDKRGETNFQNDNLFYSTKYFNKNGKHFIIGVSAENYFYTHHLSYLRQLLFISLILGVLLMVVISLYTKRSFMKPIYEMINEVENIGSENLHRRLTEPKDNGILNKLSLTFNNMLNRIETSFETQKNFISNASHELNTPLTSIIGIADVALSKERSIEDYQKSLYKILEAAENLERKTSALLLLARTGYNNNKLNLKPVRIDQILMDAKLTLMQINPNFRIIFDFTLLPEDSMRLKINGSAPLLQLAISNIISNACKYSADQKAYIGLGASDDKVIIIIKDDGIGIPKDDIDRIYDPYYRGSNTENYLGYGIGLPLSRNIIRMHKGQLNISSTLGQGTTVRIELPSITSI